MPGDQPFAIITASVSGLTVAVTPGPVGTSGTGTLDSTNRFTPNILVVNGGPGLVWFRMTSETTPAATLNDVALPAGSIRLFANPSPLGKTGIAVIATLTSSLANVYFIPGEDGVS